MWLGHIVILFTLGLADLERTVLSELASFHVQRVSKERVRRFSRFVKVLERTNIHFWFRANVCLRMIERLDGLEIYETEK
jgi:hypothetical protein